MKRVIPLVSAAFLGTAGFSSSALAQQPAATPPPAAAPDTGWSAAPAPAPTAAPAPAPAPGTAPATAPQPAPEPLPPSPVAPAPAATASDIQVAQPPPPPPPKRDDYAGPRVLISTKKPAFGGYGGLAIAYTNMLDRDGALIGLEGAFLIDHRLSLGLAGYGFTRTPSGPPTALGTPREYATAYGGFQIRYAAFIPDVPIYASLGMLFGGGSVVLALDHDWNDDWEEDDGNYDEVSTGYFVVQPDITLHTNVTRWLRFGITGGYRFAGPVDDGEFDGDKLKGVVVGGNLHAGWL